MPQAPHMISLADAAWNYPKYPCFCILPLEFGVTIDVHKYENTHSLNVKTAINLQRKGLGTPDCQYMETY